MLKKTFSAYAVAEKTNRQPPSQVSGIHPAIYLLAKWLRRLGRGAMLVSFIVGLFAAKAAQAKLGFMILLPAGIILVALAGYLVRQIKFYKFRLTGREAQLFAFVVGGCAFVALTQVLVQRFILHTV